MKIFAAVLVLLAITGACFAGQNVKGYIRKNGTYVAPQYKTSPDRSYNNNYSTKGNVNPYTTKSGTNSRTYNDRTPDYNKKTYGNPGYENSYGVNSNSGRKSKSLYGY